MNKSARYWASIAYFHYLESQDDLEEEDILHAFYDEHKIRYGIGWYRSEHLDCFSDELFWHFINNVSGMTASINEELGPNFGKECQTCARVVDPPFNNQTRIKQPRIQDEEPLC